MKSSHNDYQRWALSAPHTRYAPFIWHRAKGFTNGDLLYKLLIQVKVTLHSLMAL